VIVNDEPTSLCEAKSPSVMEKVGELLPALGIELEWNHSPSLVRRILGKVSSIHFSFFLFLSSVTITKYVVSPHYI